MTPELLGQLISSSGGNFLLTVVVLLIYFHYQRSGQSQTVQWDALAKRWDALLIVIKEDHELHNARIEEVRMRLESVKGDTEWTRGVHDVKDHHDNRYLHHTTPAMKEALLKTPQKLDILIASSETGIGVLREIAKDSRKRNGHD